MGRLKGTEKAWTTFEEDIGMVGCRECVWQKDIP